jgi:hypothetical protein
MEFATPETVIPMICGLNILHPVVMLLRLGKNIGEPNVIQVRQVFVTKEDAIEWEDTVIRRLDIVKDPKWLNVGRRGVEFSGQTQHSDETKKKMKDVWADPSRRDTRIKSIQQSQKSDDARKNKSEAVKRTWETPSERRESSRQLLADRNRSDASRQMSSEISQRNWSDPAFRIARSNEKKGGVAVYDTITQSFIRVSCSEYALHKNEIYYNINSKYVKNLNAIKK